MEMLFLVAFLSIISLVFIAAAGMKMNQFSEKQKSDAVKDFGISIKKEFDLASVVKNGYRREIEIPQEIGQSIPYTISNSNSTLIISTEKKDYTAIIPKVKGTLSKGKNIIKKTNNSIYIQ